MDSLERLRPYSLVLYVLAAIGLFGVNGVFLYYSILHPEILDAAMANPISLVFMIEAFLMMGFLAWVATRYALRRPGWLAFIVMTMLGSLAFSVPAFLLIHLRKRRRAHE